MTRGITPYGKHSHRMMGRTENLYHTLFVDNNKQDDDEEDESGIESPTKRYKGMVSAATKMTTPSSSRRRSFGEELEPNNRVIIDNTSLLLRHHKDNNTLAASTASVADDGSAATSSSSQGSSVAALRGLLDDFGKQQKKHFETTSALGQAPADAHRPTRPKVVPAKQAANAPTPLPPPAASALQRRLADTGLSTRHPRTTPIRIQTKETAADVRATNEGYKSVKELSAWLADDPTKEKKKVKCLRRGANVIAKSRAFDKGLKDVIIEQDLGLRSVHGLVASKKQLLAHPSLSIGSSSCGGHPTHSSHDWEETEHAPAWPVPDTLETASAISVSDKKQWLSSAFKKAGGAKAHTEVITAQDEREAVSNRAKHLWRQRAKVKSAPTSSSTAVSGVPPPTFTQKSVAARKSISTATNVNNKQVVVKPMDPPASASKRTTVEPPLKATTNPPTLENKNEDIQEAFSPTKYGFSAAREFIVQKSRQNGNPVDGQKVKNRMAKYEQIEARRKSSQPTLHKTAWVEPQDTVSSSRAFVRTVVPNTAPKKSVEELP